MKQEGLGTVECSDVDGFTLGLMTAVTRFYARHF